MVNSNCTTTRLSSLMHPPSASLSTLEDRVLLCAAHPHLSPERQEVLTSLLSSPLSWSRLLEQVDRHGLAPLLYAHLQKMPDVTIPQDARTALVRCAYGSLAWNLCLQRELISLLGEFNQANVAVMPLKGPVLADLLYGDLALRPTTDLDLLVHVEDLTRAGDILLRAGCQRVFSPQQEEGLYHYLFTIERGEGVDILVELHWDLTSSHLTRLNVQEAWASATRTVWEGREVWMMAIPDLFLYLCTHAMRDGLGSVKTLLDITLMVERFGETWRWEDLAKRVKATHIETPVFLSLSQSRELLGTAVPQEFLAAIRPVRGIGWYLGQALFKWRGGVLHSPIALLRSPMATLLTFLWEDSVPGKFRHIQRIVCPPAGLRTRRTALPSSAAFFRWYPLWLWRACCQFARQFAIRFRERQ